jgi:hypothetical protein
MPHKLDNLYAGRPIYVISTGTSLRGFDFARLDGKLTLGINRIIEYYNPSIFFCIDITAHETHAHALRSYNGMIIAGPNAGPTRTHSNVFEVPHSGGTFEIDGELHYQQVSVGRSFCDGLFGTGAGCTALHAAILLGGDPIYLLGYDFYEQNGRHFDEYDEAMNEEHVYNLSFRCLEQLSREDWLPRIYCCNPNSRLTCFPRAELVNC